MSDITKKQYDMLHEAIVNQLKERTKEIVKEEANYAAARVEERVRGLAGQIATQVSSWVNYQTLRNEIIITVKIPEVSK